MSESLAHSIWKREQNMEQTLRIRVRQYCNCSTDIYQAPCSLCFSSSFEVGRRIDASPNLIRCPLRVDYVMGCPSSFQVKSIFREMARVIFQHAQGTRDAEVVVGTRRDVSSLGETNI
jgi:hypothetical protein